VKDLIARVRANPVVAHWIAAVQRFNERLGPLFAAAITYFSVLSMVPVAMVAFAALGLTLTVFLPDQYEALERWIRETVSGPGSAGDQVVQVIEGALSNWGSVGVVGLVSALWAGATWVKRLRAAIRAQMAPEPYLQEDKPNFALQTLRNAAILFGLLALVLLTVAVSTAATAARTFIADLLGLADGATGAAVLSGLPLLTSLLAGFVLFWFIFRVFPEQRYAPWPVLVRGAALGSVGMAGLQYGAGIILGIFANNAAAAVFGSVIVLMLFLNLFAVLILMVAAWLATHPRTERAREVPAPVVAAGLPREPTDYATKQLRATIAAADADTVPREAAVTATRVGMTAGAAAASLVTLGVAAAASFIAGLRDRRR